MNEDRSRMHDYAIAFVESWLNTGKVNPVYAVKYREARDIADKKDERANRQEAAPAQTTPTTTKGTK